MENPRSYSISFNFAGATLEHSHAQSKSGFIYNIQDLVQCWSVHYFKFCHHIPHSIHMMYGLINACNAIAVQLATQYMLLVIILLLLLLCTVVAGWHLAEQWINIFTGALCTGLLIPSTYNAWFCSNTLIPPKQSNVITPLWWLHYIYILYILYIRFTYYIQLFSKK